MRYYQYITIFILLLIGATLQAKITLPPIIADNMILQQQELVKVWGKGKQNTKITVKTSWDNQKYTTRSDVKGYWNTSIQTPTAGGPYSIEFSDGELLTIKNILIGEVWLCSGQSNMEMPVKGFRGQPIEGSQETIVTANPNRAIRLFNVKRAFSTTPQDTLNGVWSENTSMNVANFSATAYYFGDLLQKALGVPVGLVHSSWSASKIEAWMDKETLSKFSDVQLPDSNKKDFSWPAGTPTLLYNAMIHPLSGLTIKGIIWYQGESNSLNPKQYSKLFPAWISQWRTFFKSETLPVYYVQIAPYQSDGKDKITTAIFRESQLKSMKEIPHVGMAFTIDAGSEKFIHAPYKKKIGERLAFWALAKTYMKQGISYCGPTYTKHIIKGNKVEITFENGNEGLTPENEFIEGFEIAASDSIFHPAKAQIINGTSRVEVWSDSITRPIEVRYCFRNYKTGNLYNNAAIPAAPFRISLKQSTY